MITEFECGGNQWCLRTAAAAKPKGTPAAIGTWQGGIVLDPACPELKSHFLAQLRHKYDHIANFEGLVVDRADWNAVYNHAFDDGASFIANRTAQLLQYSTLDTLRAMRGVMTARAPAMAINETVMLSNNQGFAQLSLCPGPPAACKEPWHSTRSESVLYGVFVWACGALDDAFRLFPARTVEHMDGSFSEGGAIRRRQRSQ